MKTKTPLHTAQKIADAIVEHLRPGCERIEIAGSIRRRKPEVGDIEIIYIPRISTAPDPADFFATATINHAEHVIDLMQRAGTLAKRPNVNGGTSWGSKIKLALHVESGIGVDLFATNRLCWFNYLVCRTGPAEFNTRIATLAQERGWKWHPFNAGFERLSDGEWFKVASERDVFDFLGLSYLDPWERR